VRRDAGLLKTWAPLAARMRPHTRPAVRPVTGKFPAGITAHELVSPLASAVSIVNQTAQPYRADLQVWDPAERRTTVIPAVEVPAGESLWLPVGVSLAGGGLCRDCAGLAGVERVLYATAELQAIEFENGILAMEFAAPVKGEVAIQFSRKPRPAARSRPPHRIRLRRKNPPGAPARPARLRPRPPRPHRARHRTA
jgi:hypothetical protein